MRSSFCRTARRATRRAQARLGLTPYEFEMPQFEQDDIRPGF